MLRASKLCQNSIRSASQQRVGSLIAKRMETTTTTTTTTAETTTTSKKGSIGKKLLGLAFVTGASYGGAVYYALNDDDFRRTFTTHVPGGMESVTFVEDLKANNDLHNYQDQATNYKKQAEGYLTVAKDAANNAYDYATDTYSKLTGATEPPKLKTNIPTSSTPVVSTLPGHTNTHDGILTSDKANTTTPVVTAVIDRPPPILVKRVPSDHAVVRELSRVVTELASILNDAGLANAGRDILTQAEDQLRQLNARYQALDKEQEMVLEGLQQLKNKADGVEKGLDRLHGQVKDALVSTHAATGDKIKTKEAQVQQDSEAAREQLKQSFSDLLVTELGAQKQQLERERAEALMEQAAELKRLFVRDVKMLVERERAGRLAKLDTIAQRFQSIEQSSLQNALALDNARQTHQLYVALSAVQDAVGTHFKQPFVDEWEALRQGAQHDEGLVKILGSIPRDTVEEGIASVGELAARFDTVADQVRRVALVPENGGFGAHIVSFIMSKLLFKKQGLVEGDDVEAVLARSTYYLQKNDLENAARELNQLQGWPKKLACGWIVAARQHLELKQALEIVESKVILSSLADA
ncbi:mitochondrial inner membrane protein Mitofilin [Chlamydoabsidia padenii]|nr:mitochondrial inner membrane protein Mitofilin [Chlamydoabsidia padenii]